MAPVWNVYTKGRINTPIMLTSNSRLLAHMKQSRKGRQTGLPCHHLSKSPFLLPPSHEWHIFSNSLAPQRQVCFIYFHTCLQYAVTCKSAGKTAFFDLHMCNQYIRNGAIHHPSVCIFEKVEETCGLGIKARHWIKTIHDTITGIQLVNSNICCIYILDHVLPIYGPVAKKWADSYKVFQTLCLNQTYRKGCLRMRCGFVTKVICLLAPALVFLAHHDVCESKIPKIIQ